MGTTAGGFPYPDPTDPFANVDLAIKALADELESQSRHACRVYQTSGQSIASSASVAVLLTFDSESADPLGMHSTSSATSRITVPRAGRYLVNSCVTWASNATGFRQLALYRNGALDKFTRIPPVNGSVTAQQVCSSVLCAAGDYLELYALQNSGSSLTLSAGDAYTWFEAVRVASV